MDYEKYNATSERLREVLMTKSRGFAQILSTFAPYSSRSTHFCTGKYQLVHIWQTCNYVNGEKYCPLGVRSLGYFQKPGVGMVNRPGAVGGPERWTTDWKPARTIMVFCLPRRF